MELILENVRSFCDQHSIPLRPLTLLVGENSTGKTSFLAMLAHVYNPGFPSTRPAFNIPPFDLGTFDSIATYKRGKYGRADSFSVGFDEKNGSKGRKLVASYASYRGQPLLTKVFATGAAGEVTITVNPESHMAKLSASSVSPDGLRINEYEFDLRRVIPADLDYPIEIVFRNAFMELAQKGTKAGALGSSPAEFLELSRLLQTTRKPVFALSPVRTKPRRTYDEYSDDFEPEGDHIPVILARLGEEHDDAKGPKILQALKEFGEMSGLYKKITARHLGSKPTDPFQIMVETGGAPANLPDVGYGVSQTLPIVVQSVLAAERGMLLLQQPEVHLHPRGQAALGSFFARLVAKEKKELVIETHSDHLLDRVRREVAQGTLRASDVLILFFEKEYIETRVHQIELDEQGNITHAPDSYRRFFLEEELDLLTRAKR
jgi:energy-coupling factor transporter ATP-binding protein EcfA2